MVKSGSRAPNVDQRLSILATVASFWLETRFVNVRKMAIGLEKHQSAYESRRSIDLDFVEHACGLHSDIIIQTC